MKKITIVFLVIFAVLTTGCQKEDPRINLREGVQSDSLIDNIVTRPVAYAFSALIGEGIEIDQALLRKNSGGLLELNINGHNRSYGTRRFKYRVEWLDGEGIVIQSKTSTWLPASAMGKSPFSIKAVAPNTNAVNFRMDTKEWE
jgi:uncharacterized protein YcfL